MAKKICLVVLTALMAGCASFSSNRFAERDANTILVVRELYFTSRTFSLRGPSAIQCILLPNTNVVSSCESLLIHFSQNKDEPIRLEAGEWLTQFGTMRAVERALTMARNEKSPETRAALWKALIAILGGPEWMDNRSMIVPPELDLAWLQGQALSQYETDDGAWLVQYTDRIPFVPFSGRHSTETNTVRESIAYGLMKYAKDTKTVVAAFRQFASSTNPAISKPAKEALEDMLQSQSLTPETSQTKP